MLLVLGFVFIVVIIIVLKGTVDKLARRAFEKDKGEDEIHIEKMKKEASKRLEEFDLVDEEVSSFVEEKLKATDKLIELID